MSGAHESPVRIEEVAYLPNRRERLLDRHLDEPRPGDTPGERFAFRISGWALGNHSPLIGVEAVHRGVVIAAAPAHERPDLRDRSPEIPHAAQSGIHLAISALDLPLRFRFNVRAVLADETRSPIAAITGSRAPLQAAPGPGPAPVLLTMIGRSGSTALANLLCDHPDIAGYRTWETETRVVSYWTDVLRALARPHSYERQLNAGATLAGDWWTGRRPPYPAPPNDDLALDAVGRSAVDVLASFCSLQVGLVTKTLASIGGKPDASWFVEKAEPAMLRSVAEVMEELDPRTREILLVRDPRDMACSMHAYSSRKQGIPGFGPGPGASIEDTIRWLSFNGITGLADYMTRRGGELHVVRYEDLIGDPETTLIGVLEHIGASRDPGTVADMLEQLAAQEERRAEHATTDSTARSVGRWRNDLTPAQQELAGELFGPQLAVLGYD